MSEQDHFPWDDITTGNIFESGVYQFEIATFDDGKSSTGKRMPKIRFVCVAPANFKGMAYFDQYTVATEEEPDNVVASTIGARNMKQLFDAAQVPKGNNIVELMNNSIGNHVLLQLNKYEETGDYAGWKNKVIGMYKIGEREVGLTAVKGGAGGVVAPSGAPKPANAPVSSAPKVDTHVCTNCGKSIPADEYSAHVETCQG